MNINEAVMLIDGQNAAIRHYCANPTLNSSGDPIGMIVGFLNGLRSLVGKFKPKLVIIAWDGEDGSKRRRKLFPEYKANRKPPKLNRFYEESFDSEENRIWQMITLIKLLSHLPVIQVYVKTCEADDVISCLCRGLFKEDKKIIVSSDKDFYQLINDDTTIYSLTKKELIDELSMINSFGILPRHFSMAKALAGDGSDCIPGIKGVGFKTLKKKFPELSTNESFELQTLLESCNKRSVKNNDIYQRIINDFELIKINHRIIDLNDGWMIDSNNQHKIESTIDVSEKKINKLGIMQSLYNVGITQFDYDSLIMSLRYLASK